MRSTRPTVSSSPRPFATPKRSQFRALFDLEYGAPSKLQYRAGGYFISSESGVRQGSVLGPLFFCALMQDILVEVRAKFPDLYIAAYMDDISLVGPAASGVAAFKFIRERLLAMKVKVNEPKWRWPYPRTDKLVQA